MTPPLSEAQRMELLHTCERFLFPPPPVNQISVAISDFRRIMDVLAWAKSQLSRQPEAATRDRMVEVICRADVFVTGEIMASRIADAIIAAFPDLIDAQARALSVREAEVARLSAK